MQPGGNSTQQPQREAGTCRCSGGPRSDLGAATSGCGGNRHGSLTTDKMDTANAPPGGCNGGCYRKEAASSGCSGGLVRSGSGQHTTAADEPRMAASGHSLLATVGATHWQRLIAAVQALADFGSEGLAHSLDAALDMAAADAGSSCRVGHILQQ
jgi:hypothetical protein